MNTSLTAGSFFRQDRQWVDPLSYQTSYGDLARTYVYTCELTYADDFGSAWRAFDPSIAHLPDALAELAPALAADELFDHPLRDTLRAWRRDGIPVEVEKQWTEAGHPAAALKVAEAAVRAAERLPDDLMDPLGEVVACLTRLASGRAAWAREILALDAQ